MPTWAPNLKSFRPAIVVTAGDRVVRQRDDRLVHVVVAVGQVDRLGALGAERDLVEVDVEVLGARARYALSNGTTIQVDVVLGEAELLGDRVGDGALEALAVGRVAELPRRGRRAVRDLAKYGG